MRCAKTPKFLRFESGQVSLAIVSQDRPRAVVGEDSHVELAIAADEHVDVEGYAAA